MPRIYFMVNLGQFWGLVRNTPLLYFYYRVLARFLKIPFTNLNFSVTDVRILNFLYRPLLLSDFTELSLQNFLEFYSKLSHKLQENFPIIRGDWLTF